MEARAISVKVLASKTSKNGEMFGSVVMTDDNITPAEGRTRDVRVRAGQAVMVWWRKPSPSSSSTAPGDATKTGSEGKHDSCFHSVCFLVTMSILPICWRDLKVRI